MKVFLAVPLAYNRSLDRTRLMAKAIRDSGHEVVSTWNLDPSEVLVRSTANVFERDKSISKLADVLVADLTDPSTGVGMEIMAAHEAGKKVILVSKKGKPIPPILQDMDNKEELEYENESDIYEGLRRFLA